MKTILVPTDFSEPANNALDYAARLAGLLRARLILLHVFWVPVYEFDSRQETQAKEKDFREYAQRQLEKTEKRIRMAHPDLKLDVLIRNGMVGDEIVRMAHIHRAAMVVMGTKGASGLAEVLMGSNTTEVIEKSDCPVLAIPTSTRWQGLRQIVVAVDYHDSDVSAICELTELAEACGAKVTLLHQISAAHTTADRNALRELIRNVRKQTAYELTDYALLEGEDFLESVNAYLDEHQADMLAVSTRKRGFWSRLFGRSHTRQLIRHLHQPLMVFQACDLPHYTI